MSNSNQIPRGYRNPEDDDSVYRSDQRDPSIEPDYVSPCTEGYFRIPHVWLVEEKIDDEYSTTNPQLNNVVYRNKLDCGIEVLAQRNGAFSFDFTSYSLAPMVLIPGYRIPREGAPYRAPDVTIEAYRKSHEYLIIRSQINEHSSGLSSHGRKTRPS